MTHHSIHRLPKARLTRLVEMLLLFHPWAVQLSALLLTTLAHGSSIVCTFLLWFHFRLIPYLGHIEWHLEAGLAITLVVAPDQMAAAASEGNVPQFMYDQCAELGQSTTGNAAGLNSTTDLTGLTLGPNLQNNGWHSRGIGAMAGCVLTAVLGMLTVVWYSAFGPQMSEEDVEEDVKRKIERGGKVQRIKGLFARK